MLAFGYCDHGKRAYTTVIPGIGWDHMDEIGKPQSRGHSFAGSVRFWRLRRIEVEIFCFPQVTWDRWFVINIDGKCVNG